MTNYFSSRTGQDIEIFEPKAVKYCGLSVEVLCQMEHCSLIRYRDREFVINTEDVFNAR